MLADWKSEEEFRRRLRDAGVYLWLFHKVKILLNAHPMRKQTPLLVDAVDTGKDSC